MSRRGVMASDGFPLSCSPVPAVRDSHESTKTTSYSPMGKLVHAAGVVSGGI
jgi:hypothetical protein